MTVSTSLSKVAERMGIKARPRRDWAARRLKGLRKTPVGDPKAGEPLQVLKPVSAATVRAKSARRAKSASARDDAGASPPRGRVEAIALFILAGAILAWPRDPSTLSKVRLSLRTLFARRPHEKGHAQTLAAEAAEPGRGRSARNPAEIPIRGWKDIVWRAWGEFNKDNIPQVAGGVAFFGLLAIFPAIAAFVSLYGLFFDVSTARKQLDVLAGVLPADALTLVGDQMIRLAATHHSGLGLAFAIGLLVSLWSANAGMKALMVGLNIAFEEKEKRNFLKLSGVSLAFTFGALVFILIALTAVVVVPAVLAAIGYQGGFLPILRWPILMLVAIGAIAVLYRYGPSRQQQRWSWLSWGSVIAAILWLCVSLLFSLFVSHFNTYGRTYGPLGAVIGFMSWIWISTIAVLFGAEINTEIEHQTTVDTTTGAPVPMGSRGATMADTIGAARPPKRRGHAETKSGVLSGSGRT